MPKKATLQETESVGKVLEERKKSSVDSSDAEYRALYQRVKAGEISKIEAAKQLRQIYIQGQRLQAVSGFAD